ncbi:MAG TPA: helix-hairpin-helix domain-containing protein, partial [Ignavibacteriaceae bacterium]|nr:helix-hairpin-helix domain-containing protein [Ignavibacteriaceae bacterium]
TEEDFKTDSTDAKENSVDYKQEVLDFKPHNFSEGNVKKIPAEKSLDINTIKLDELMLLPGIGKKTAERIIDLRNKRGKFNSLKELREIKGIGETKFQNITKYLYIK